MVDHPRQLMQASTRKSSNKCQWLFLRRFLYWLKDASTQKHLSASLCWFPWGLPNLRGIEKPIYEYTGSDKPFYYYKDKTDYPDEKVPETERHPDNHLPL